MHVKNRLEDREWAYPRPHEVKCLSSKEKKKKVGVIKTSAWSRTNTFLEDTPHGYTCLHGCRQRIISKRNSTAKAVDPNPRFQNRSQLPQKTEGSWVRLPPGCQKRQFFDVRTSGFWFRFLTILSLLGLEIQEKWLKKIGGPGKVSFFFENDTARTRQATCYIARVCNAFIIQQR